MRAFRIFAVIILLCLSVAVTSASAGSVWQENTSVTISTGTRAVKTVRVSLADPGIEIRPVLAGDRVGLTEPLSGMAARSGAVAAINGTFFRAYTDNQPQGTIQSNGVFHHLSSGAAVGFTESNRMIMDRLKPEIKGGINGSREWPNNWYAWSINSPRDDSDAIIIYTPSYRGGRTVPPSARSVVVRSGRVTDIVSGSADIPSDGYVIGFGPSCGEIAGRFSVGDTVEYSVNQGPGWDSVRNALSAGPLLLKNGEIVVDPAAEGMSDPKITSQKGARSFIGLKDGNTLVMGTTSPVTVRELAEITRALGLSEAMNLDGGASSGLYFNGGYITTPGRNLSNCLVVVRSIPVRLNGRKITGFEPYVIPPGVTMVPVRGLFENMGATVGWDGSRGTVTVNMGSVNIVMPVGSRSVSVNGKDVSIPAAVEIKNGRTYIPLRFVAESLGARVEWDENYGTVDIYTGRE
ncbi:MAG: stalk domain-containing protein [Bacillota bacterium]